jgi:hypothetical protein
MRKNKLTTPPAAFGRRSDSSKAGKVPAIENSPSASDLFAAKIAQREGKSVKNDNQAYIAVLLAEIERKKDLLKHWANEAEPPKTPAKT